MAKSTGGRRSPAKKAAKSASRFTYTQGQYLAYLRLYRKLHRRSPSETEIAEYFRVSPPSVHQMIVKLEEKGLITREPGVPRSVRIAVPKDQIPDLEDREAEADQAQAASASPARTAGSRPTRLYTLQVFLIGGPVPERFGGQEIRRDVQIRGDQTLEALHCAIFQAYNRWDEHFYEFQFGKGPHDPQGKRYVLPPMFAQEDDDSTIAGDVTRTTIDSLGLKVDQHFGYWFDYGDDWWHQIDVEAIEEKAPRGRFPRVTKRVGKSPPQYSEEE
jgi:hypothetical protein